MGGPGARGGVGDRRQSVGVGFFPPPSIARKHHHASPLPPSKGFRGRHQSIPEIWSPTNRSTKDLSLAESQNMEATLGSYI